MTQYLAALHRLDDYDPSMEDAAMGRDIGALNAFNFDLSILDLLLELHP